MTHYDERLRFAQSSDTGEDEAASIQPIGNEKVEPVVANRSPEHLRGRTERVRDAVEALNYLANYDRALLLRSDAQFELAFSFFGGAYTLSMVSGTEGDLWVYPSLTPGRISGGRYRGGRVFVGNLPYCGTLLVNDISFVVDSNYVGHRNYADGKNFNGGGGNPAISLGANGVTLSLVADPAVAGGTISSTISGGPKRKIVITYGTLTTSTTIDQIIAYVNNPANTFTGESYGLAAFFRASRDPATPGTAAPTAFTDAPVRGGYDAEAHQVTAAQLAAFFGVADNRLQEGECLAIAYEPGLVETGVAVPKGGRRQSLWDLPTNRTGTRVQNTTPSLGYSLFNTGREPHKIPGAIPIGKIIEGEFIFLDGTRVSPGTSGRAKLGESQTVWQTLAATTPTPGATYIGYGGSDYYDDWTSDDHEGAGHRRLPAGSIEAALDRVVEDFGRINADNSGARRVGAEAVTGVVTIGNLPRRLSLPAGSVRQQIAAILNGEDGSSNVIGLNGRVSERGHFLRGRSPIEKDFRTEAPSGGGVTLRGTHETTGNLSLAATVTKDNHDLASLQPIEFAIDGNFIPPVLGGTATRYLLTSESITRTGSEGANYRLTLNGTGIDARWADIKAALPCGAGSVTTVMAGLNPTAPVYHIVVLLTAPSTPALTGYYYLTEAGTGGAKILSLLSLDSVTVPNFSGADMTGASISFFATLLVGNDITSEKIRAFHAGNTAFMSVASKNYQAPLLESFVPDATFGSIRATALYPGRGLFLQPGTSIVRNTDDILVPADKSLLDGGETSVRVNAALSHHHGMNDQHFVWHDNSGGVAVQANLAGGWTTVSRIAWGNAVTAADALEVDDGMGGWTNTPKTFRSVSPISTSPIGQAKHALLLEVCVYLRDQLAGDANTNVYSEIIFESEDVSGGVRRYGVRVKAQAIRPTASQMPIRIEHRQLILVPVNTSAQFRVRGYARSNNIIREDTGVEITEVAALVGPINAPYPSTAVNA